jgi:hypothetical protein
MLWRRRIGGNKVRGEVVANWRGQLALKFTDALSFCFNFTSEKALKSISSAHVP